jgi:hypothetical protein
MLDEEFRKQRARTVRDLADKAADPFMKGRLLDLAARYEDDGIKPPNTLSFLTLNLVDVGVHHETAHGHRQRRRASVHDGRRTLP